MNNGDYTYINPNGGKDTLDIMMMDMNNVTLITKWSCQTIFSTRTTRTPNGIIKIPFSDHRGMVAVLCLDHEMNEPPDRISWNFDEKKKKLLQNEIKKKMKLWNMEYERHKNNPDKIDQLVEYFQLLLTTTAQKILGFRKFNSQSINWIDNTIYDILKEKRKIKNKISHLLSKIKKHFFDYKSAPRVIKRKLNRFKQKRNKLSKKLKRYKYRNMMRSTMKIERLINDPNVNKEKLFYGAINKISNRSSVSIPPLRDPSDDHVIASTDAEIADELHKYYVKPLKRNTYEPKHIVFHEHVDNFVNNYENNNNNSDNIVNREFTEQEVLYVINNLNRNSAMAFDYIHYELVYWVKHQIVYCLTKLFNLCFVKHQKCRNIWKFSEFVPVPKPGRPSYYCKNIRPISIHR